MNWYLTRRMRFALLLMGITAVSLQAGEVAFAASSGATACNIQFGSCTARTQDGIVVEFDVQPKPVTPMSELTLIVKLSKNGAPVTDASVQVDLTMPGMFMGTTRPSLDHIEKGRYEGRGILMRCASGKKTWQADVIIGAGAQSVAGFRFEVQ